MQEIWKVYKETYNNRWGKRIYEVSNQGNVKVNGKLIEIKEVTNGYPSVGKFNIHRAVAELFIPNPENKPCVDHIDTNPNNNNYLNLRWVTHKENNNNPITRKHNSSSHIGREPSRGFLGHHRTQEWKMNHSKKISELQKNTKMMTDGIINVRVKPEHWGEFIDIGFKFGKTKKSI